MRSVALITGSFVLAAFGGGGSSTSMAQERADVQTSQGLISGLLDATFASPSLHQRVFKRVRYAAAPVGELRFKAPEPPPMIEGTYDASAFGPSCAQLAPNLQERRLLGTKIASS